jgi:hypothetical protein
MSLVAVAAGKGAPGVTTASLVLAAIWSRRSVLLECDPAGGDLVYRLRGDDGRPLAADRGVVSLATAARGPAGTPNLWLHTQQAEGGLPVLVGVGSPAQSSALGSSWAAVADLCADSPDADVIADCGRLSLPSPAAVVFRRASRLLLLCRATAESVGHTRTALEQLRVGGLAEVPMSLLVVGDGDAMAQVATALRGFGELDVVGPLADDPMGAAGLAGQWTRRLDRSRLVVSARVVARAVDARLPTRRATHEPTTVALDAAAPVTLVTEVG